MKSGWFNESKRHSLASRGIKTAQKMPMVHKMRAVDKHDLYGDKVWIDESTGFEISRKLHDKIIQFGIKSKAPKQEIVYMIMEKYGISNDTANVLADEIMIEKALLIPLKVKSPKPKNVSDFDKMDARETVMFTKVDTTKQLMEIKQMLGMKAIDMDGFFVKSDNNNNITEIYGWKGKLEHNTPLKRFK